MGTIKLSPANGGVLFWYNNEAGIGLVTRERGEEKGNPSRTPKSRMHEVVPPEMALASFL